MKGHPVLSIVAVLVTMFATLANLKKISKKIRCHGWQSEKLWYLMNTATKSAGVDWKLKKNDWLDLSTNYWVFTGRIWLCVDQVIANSFMQNATA